MTPGEDLSSYLGIFLEDATEQIALLESGILRLEGLSSQPQRSENGAFNSVRDHLLDEVFRAAHSLKGAARAMGFDAIGELTHAMEDILGLLRAGELEIARPMVDALLTALDDLKSAREAIAETGSDLLDPAAAVRLREVLLDGPAIHNAQSPIHSLDPPLTETVRMAVHEAQLCGLHVYRLTVSLAPDCAMKSVRAVLVLKALDAVGSPLCTFPDEDAIDNEQFETSFQVVLASDLEPEAVAAAALGVSEVETATAIAISDEYACDPGEADSLRSSPGLKQETEPDTPHRATSEIRSPRSEIAAGRSGHTIRVDVERLDNLLNLVGELVIDQTRLSQIAAAADSGLFGDRQSEAERLRDATAHLARITGEIQTEIMKARMLPLDHLFSRFPRMVRDLARKLGKEVEFEVSGHETELDRSVIEVIGDPLIHLLRNCVDHGIEPPPDRLAEGKPAKGRVAMRARHEESQIIIEIEDDGRGIDPGRLRSRAAEIGHYTPETAARLTDSEAMDLIFSPGFSTADRVTEVSGRGVGMDIVRNNLARFGASVRLESRIGKGTRFIIKLPLTLAIIRGLLVNVAGGTFVLPLSAVVEATRVKPGQLHRIPIPGSAGGYSHNKAPSRRLRSAYREVVLHRGETLPILRLDEHFGAPEGSVDSQIASVQGNSSLRTKTEIAEHIVVVGTGADRIGVIVDSLVGEQEIVIKSLSKYVGETRSLSGATILGDGRIALIIDVNGLFDAAALARDRPSTCSTSEGKAQTYAA